MLLYKCACKSNSKGEEKMNCKLHGKWSGDCGMCQYQEYSRSREEGYSVDTSFGRSQKVGGINNE